MGVFPEFSRGIETVKMSYWGKKKLRFSKKRTTTKLIRLQSMIRLYDVQFEFECCFITFTTMCHFIFSYTLFETMNIEWQLVFVSTWDRHLHEEMFPLCQRKKLINSSEKTSITYEKWNECQSLQWVFDSIESLFRKLSVSIKIESIIEHRMITRHKKSLNHSLTQWPDFFQVIWWNLRKID